MTWKTAYADGDAAFAGCLPIKSETVSKAFWRMTDRLFTEGTLTKAFSPHALRHFAAVREYRRTKDIEYVRVFLGHANINTTQQYLRGLHV